MADLHLLTSLNVACVSTCPPRQCGIATFGTDLAHAMRQVDLSLDLRFAAVEVEPDDDYAADVEWRVSQGHASHFTRLADELNAASLDAVLLQHEFGLYGHWGPTFDDYLGPFLSRLRVPLVSLLHSVPPQPSPSVRAAVEQLARYSAGLIVMAESARDLLVDQYGIARRSIRVVLHGVPAPSSVPRAQLRRELGVADRHLITTFGFLDPHKGLEHMVTAMGAVAATFPEALYVIVGRTHPELARREGEAYRRRLDAEIMRRGLEDHVAFVDEYVDLDTIVAYLAATDVYVTPYLDMDQVTSGTLAYALGQGRVVVSTPYVHAREALANGRGVLVPAGQAAPLADAVIRVLGDPTLRRRIETRAAVYGSSMAWPRVGAQVLDVLQRAASRGSVALSPRRLTADEPATSAVGAADGTHAFS